MSLYVRISSYVLVLQIGQAFARKMEATQHAAAAGHPGGERWLKRGAYGVQVGDVTKLSKLRE